MKQEVRKLHVHELTEGGWRGKHQAEHGACDVRIMPVHHIAERERRTGGSRRPKGPL